MARALPNEQKAGATRLGFMLNHYARGSDLAQPYNQSVKNIAAPNAKSPYNSALTWAAVAAGAYIGYKAIRNPNIKNINKNYKVKPA